LKSCQPSAVSRQQAARPAKLIVNADDLGFTRDVNRGILEAHERGVLTSATMMASGAAFEDAVGLARSHPGLDIGVHLVLIGGEPVASPGKALPATTRELLWRLVSGSPRGWIERELAAQVDRILQAGLRPTHVDTHKHTHLAPPVLEAVCGVAQRFSIPWVRRPFDLPLTAAAPLAARAANAAFGLVRRRFDRTLARYRCRTTDHFAGFQWTGSFRAAELASLIRALPEGLTEFMCHPGHCTEELRAAPTRLKESRARELEALVSVEVREALVEAQVELTDYRKEMGCERAAS
jgi:predicted glycoside hydrolase/deacetylase ChbG (UPF0249 family)